MSIWYIHNEVNFKCYSFEYKGGVLLIHGYTIGGFIYSLETDIANIGYRSKLLAFSLILYFPLPINVVEGLP